MSAETELTRLTKENEHFRNIIRVQQNTIIRMVDYFILRKNSGELQNKHTEKNVQP